MTAVLFDAETGTNGTTLTTGNSGFDAVATAGGGAIFSTSAAAHGSLGYRFTESASHSNVRIDTFQSAATRIRCAFSLRISAAPSGALQVSYWTNSTNASLLPRIIINTNRTLGVQNAANTTAFNGTTALTLNTWYRVELVWVPGTTTSNGVIGFGYDLLDDPITTGGGNYYYSAAQNTGTTGVGRWTLPKLSGTWTATVDVDDIRADDATVTSDPATWLGPAVVSPNQGSGTGTWTFTGTAAGKRTPKGSGSGSWTFVGAAAGKRTPKGSGSGSWTFVGAAAGKRTPKASGSGSWTFTGAASGITTRSGTAAGTWTYAGAATGAEQPKGQGAGSWTFTGAAAGTTTRSGTGSGDLVWDGSATGTAPVVGGASGFGTGTWSFTGIAAGARAPKAAGGGLLTWAGASVGTTSHAGTATGTWAFAGTATGTFPGAVTPVAAPSETLTVRPESRTLAVAVDNRVRVVPAETRTYRVRAESRVLAVAVDDRTVTV